MIIITNPHFSQYRVSRDSLPTQSSNLASNLLRFTKIYTNCSEIQNSALLALTKSVVVFWVNWWQNVLIWQRTTCAIRTNGKNFNSFIGRNIRIGCFKGLGQSNNPIFCWCVSKHIWHCKIMGWKSRYRRCVDNSSSSASLDLKKWKNTIFAQKRQHSTSDSI